MIPILFHIGSIPIYSFGVMAAMGFLAANFVLTSETRRRGLDSGLADSLVVFGAIAGFAGARIYDAIDNWQNYAAHPLSVIFSGSGFVWYGGLIGGIISTWLVARYYKTPLLTVFDISVAPLVLGMAFGRMGCLLSGDGDWGLPSKLPWAMAYPKAIVGWHGDIHLSDGGIIPATVLKLNQHGQLVDGFFPGVRVHPAPIYEIILYLAIFAVLWSMRTRTTFAGQLVCLYLILAGAARFLVEFVRINPRVLWGLSEAQLISLLMIAAGAILWPLLAARSQTLAPREALQARG
jgi:phosphatidylglycerol:prolipoprotein diacylglycerol transferase